MSNAVEIKLRRIPALAGCLKTREVLLDGIKKGDIANDQELDLHVLPGQHIIQIGLTSQTIDITPNSSIELECGILRPDNSYFQKSIAVAVVLCLFFHFFSYNPIVEIVSCAAVFFSVMVAGILRYLYNGTDYLKQIAGDVSEISKVIPYQTNTGLEKKRIWQRSKCVESPTSFFI